MDAYNRGNWQEVDMLLDRDVKVGAPDLPLVNSAKDYVDLLIGLYPSNLKVSYRGIKYEPMSKTRGTLTGFYNLYFGGKEEENIELGYFMLFL